MSRLRIATLAAVLVITLTGCGGTSPALPGATDAKPVNPPAQATEKATENATDQAPATSKNEPKLGACDLLTEKEAEQLLGAPVKNEATDKSICDWYRKDGQKTVPDSGLADAGAVWFRMASDAEGANDVKPAFEIGSKPDNKVPGLGQDAHFLGTILHVLVNDHLSFSVSLLVGHPEDKRKEISLQIAKRALDRLK